MELWVTGPLLSEPDVLCAPDQSPEAVQEVAFLVDQVSVELSPDTTVLGLADSLMVGGCDALVTVAVCVAVPPGPVQVI